jgi:hypothetical protein
VFLRTAEKKREASRPKESNESAPPTPVDAPKPSVPEADVATPIEGPAEKAVDAGEEGPAQETAPQSADEPAAGYEQDQQV